MHKTLKMSSDINKNKPVADFLHLWGTVYQSGNCGNMKYFLLFFTPYTNDNLPESFGSEVCPQCHQAMVFSSDPAFSVVIALHPRRV